MAEETSATPTTAAAETSPMEEEKIAPPEESAPNNNLTDAPPEEEENGKAAEIASPSADHKRKLEDLEGEEEKSKEETDLETGEKKPEAEGKISEPDDAADAKRQRVDEGGADGSGVDGGQDDARKEEAAVVGNGQLPDNNTVEPGPIETVQDPAEGVSQLDILPTGPQESCIRIEVPNDKVGVLIGKAGETIRLLQNNSGARIQITRDTETDPNSSTRPVELTGTVDSISKAEQLIKNVIAEADAGGSPALVARGFGITQSGSEVYEMQVPNEKVGLIIGKGGETIKSMQTKSHARIQLIPQHLPEGDFSKERTVRISGNRKQVEEAKNIIKEVMNQTPGRQSNFLAGHSQGYRPRGSAQSQWGSRGPPRVQSQMQPNSAYDYPQRGAYPPQTRQSYGSGYPQQPPPRSNWEQRPAAPVPGPCGYDYYGQGHAMGMGTQHPNPASTQTSAPANYNYGQPQTAGYGQSNPYSQSGPQQSYGHGYTEPKYDSQAPVEQIYGQQQQPVSSQPGFYHQQGSTPQTGYAQQPPYNKPVAYAGAPQSYGPPRATQPGDPAYQGPVPSSYGSSGPSQSSYPYGTNAPSPQPGAAYGQTYGHPFADGYNQPSSAGYSQPSAQVAPSYGRQPVPAYDQPGAQSGGYGQYPPTQSAYGEQSAPNANYGYQGGTGDASYGNSAPVSGYGATPPVGSQPDYGHAGGYAQPLVNSTAYDQSMAPQTGYGSHSAGASTGYAKGVSPQPATYPGQYDSVPMYGHR